MGITLTLTGHQTDLGGGFVVRRMLPAGVRQSVGPFIFFDHFGPVVQPPSMNTDVRPHPHIGLATVTYLYEGAMMHRDNLGTVQRIEPGAINWMSAGRGIVHSERTPEDLKRADRRTHGLQLWVALPQSQEESAPTFAHTPADLIPELTQEGARVRVLVGTAWGLTSPVQALSPTLYLDIQLAAGQSLTLPKLAEEAAIYAIDQPLSLDGEAVAPHTMVVLNDEGAGLLSNPSDTEARLVIIGGAPLDGHRFIWWNFVSTQKERIVQAAQDWEAGLFKSVPGDDQERIELPPKRPYQQA
ncbi:pirin family protein [Aquabacterium sp.]|uniref:pirin family protein n=1 Tax=Aquabacterium sp. TaxID=1872578 RepID=UPI003D6D7F50